MKKVISFMFLLALLVVVASCKSVSAADDPYVTFDYNLVDIPNISIKIEQGSKTIEAKPINKDGFEFVGWLNNETLYDFNEGVYSDLVLTASFAPEKPKTNKIVFIQENEINITIDIVDNIEIGSIIGVKQIPVNIEIENYKFIGWSEQDSLTPFDFGNIIDKDYILVAKYELLDTNVRVSFMINGVLLNNKVIYTKLGSTINEPLLPDDPNNILIGWVDESGNYYNFDEPIYKDITLNAVFYPSFEVINDISKNVMRGNVKVYNTFYSNDPDSRFSTVIGSSMGSGVIIREEGLNFYVLTI